MVKSSCTRVTRQSASVIRVGVAYVNVRVSRCLKEELSWAIDKRLWLIINTVLLIIVCTVGYISIFFGDQVFVYFVSFVSMIIYEVLYT